MRTAARGSGGRATPTTTPAPFETDGVQLHPVMLSADEVEAYYEGFSNDTLWPLYHDAIRESGYHGGSGTPT